MGHEDETDEVSTALRTSRFDPTPVTDVAFDLAVVTGPDCGRCLALSGASANRLLVGTSPACDLVLTDREVSRRHLSLELEDRRVRVSDSGSTNGTTVQGVAVVTALLAGGETIHVGSTAMRLDARSEAAPSLPLATGFGRVLGASTEMRRIYPLCARLAATDVPVVIEGETGTGKEVLAEALHEQGPRAGGPFVVFDCTAVPPNLVESELFGHERGAFTGAVATRKGVFEQAHGGTLLIDEIGDLDLALQPKLLRALERSRGPARRGRPGPSAVDVRVLAATRRDLDREVQAGRFRDDLFHRLAVARVELPPLRAPRRATSRVLARHFWRELGGERRALPRRPPAALGGLRLAGQRARAAQRGRPPPRARRSRRHPRGRRRAGSRRRLRGARPDRCGGRLRGRAVRASARQGPRGVHAALHRPHADPARRQRRPCGGGVRHRTPVLPADARPSPLSKRFTTPGARGPSRLPPR